MAGGFGEALQGKHVLHLAEPSPLETGNRSKFSTRCTFLDLFSLLLSDCFPFPGSAADAVWVEASRASVQHVGLVLPC